MLLLWGDLAENLGNPIGGNVTSNVTGSDVFYEEWMSFMSYSTSISPSYSIFSSKKGTDQFMALLCVKTSTVSESARLRRTTSLLLSNASTSWTLWAARYAPNLFCFLYSCLR